MSDLALKCPHCDFSCSRPQGIGLHIKAIHPDKFVPKPHYISKRDGQQRHYRTKAKIASRRNKSVVGRARPPEAGKPSRGAAVSDPISTPPPRHRESEITRARRHSTFDPLSLSIDAAISLLCDVILLRVESTLNARIEQLIAEQITAAAIKSVPDPRPSTLGPRQLSDGELRIAMAKARIEGDQSRFGKLKAEAARRDSAAASIERGYSEDS